MINYDNRGASVCLKGRHLSITKVLPLLLLPLLLFESENTVTQPVNKTRSGYGFYDVGWHKLIQRTAWCREIKSAFSPW